MLNWKCFANSLLLAHYALAEKAEQESCQNTNTFISKPVTLFYSEASQEERVHDLTIKNSLQEQA